MISAGIQGIPIIHPEFDRPESLKIIKNFALLRLDTSVDFNRYPDIKPVCLPESNGKYVF